MKKSILSIILSGTIASTLAHSGHGSFDSTFHFMEPVHLIPVVLVIAIATWMVSKFLFKKDNAR